MTIENVQQGTLNSYLNGTTENGSGNSGVTTNNSAPIFEENKKKKILTDEEKKVMQSIGLNPDDPSAVEQWNNMEETAKLTATNKYYEQLQQKEQDANNVLNNNEVPAAAKDKQTSQTTTAQTAKAPEAGSTLSQGEAEPIIGKLSTDLPDSVLPKIKPQSLKEALDNSEAIKKITEDAKMKMREVAFNSNINMIKGNITKDMWKNMSAEERINLLKSLMPAEFQDLSKEEQQQTFMAFLDAKVKKDRDISDEEWNKYSPEKQEKLRMKYALDFDIAIKNGFTDEELESLSSYERLTYGISSAQMSYNALSEEQKQSKEGKIYEQGIVYGQGAKDTIDNVSKLLQSVSSDSEAYKDIRLSKVKQYELENNISYSELDKNQQRQLCQEDAKAISNILKNAPAEKRVHELKKVILGASGDPNYLTDLILSVQSELNLNGAQLKQLNNDIHSATQSIFEDLEKLKDKGVISDLKLSNNDDAAVKHIKTGVVSADVYSSRNLTGDNPEQGRQLARRIRLMKNDEAYENAKKTIASDTEHSHSSTVTEFMKDEKYGLGIFEATTINKSANLRLEVVNEASKAKSRGEISDNVAEREFQSFLKAPAGKKPDAQYQLAAQECMNTNNAGDKVVIKAQQNALKAGYIAKEAEVKFFNNGFEASKALPKEDIAASQKGWADVIPYMQAANQLDAHKIIMTSDFDEVLEYATQNIVNYDSSVQSEALQMSIDTGNTKAIEAAASVANEVAANEAAVASSNSGVQNNANIQQVIASTEATYTKQIIAAVTESIIENNLDASNPDVANMSAEERRQYYSDKFNSVKDLSAFIDRLPDATKKEAYIKIAMYCPNLLKTIASSHGSAILKLPGLPLRVINIVAIAMLNAGGQTKKDGAKFILKSNFFSSNIEKVAREALYGEEKKQKTASSESLETQANEQMYATMPQIISNKFMKSAFSSNFNDVNYKKIYKDMPPIKG